MEKFKIEHFWNTHKKPMAFMHVDEADTLKLKTSIEQVFVSNLGLTLDRYFTNSSIVEAALYPTRADAEEFELAGTFSWLGISPQPGIYINWKQFDDIDCFEQRFACRYFSDIWYPGVDDVEIFDSSLSWILSVSHDGRVYSLISSPISTHFS